MNRLTDVKTLKFGESVLKRNHAGLEDTPPQAASRNALAYVCILLFCLLYNKWLISGNLYFYFDDWGWLRRAEFSSWASYLQVLPNMIYNDRPFGGAFIKAMYTLFGLNHQVFSSVFLLLHVINCSLLYAIASRYISRFGSLLAAILSATWLSSMTGLTWTAAVFDILGATLCLATIYVRQLSVERRGSLALDIVGAILFAVSIRTKEFALGNISLIIIVDLLANRQKPRDVLKQLIPYLFVFVVYFIRYAYLQTHKPLDSSNLYSLDFSPLSISSNLWFYISLLFYFNLFGKIWIFFVVACIATAAITSTRASLKIALIGLFGFAAMLGPTLLIPKHRDELYLYTPHFYMALSIGAIYSNRFISKAITAIVSTGIFAAPLAFGRYENILNYYESMGTANIRQMTSAQLVLGKIEPGSRIFLAGATPIFNPFSYGHGDSLRVIYRDKSISAVEGASVAQLEPVFCASPEPKRFLEFHDQLATDLTAKLRSRCGP